MKNWKLPLALLALLPALWLACNKNDIDSDGPLVAAAFTGQVLDENNHPLEGATVCAGIASTATDVNGVFRLPATKLPARNAILKVKLNGYFDFSRAYTVAHNGLQTVRIQLLRKQAVHSFIATDNTVAQVGAAQLRFPANSIATEAGAAYNGLVYVYARYLDPTDPNLSLYMPGDLRGIGTGGEQTLATFGMIGVELSTPGGDPLQLAAGKEAEIELPISAELAAVAPAEIPLWHYDTETARWIEEGSAQKAGNQYVGKVKHFSFWNCDVGVPLVYLDGRVYLEDAQTPAQLASVRLTVLSKGWTSYGPVNNSGYFGGAVPADEAMQMDVVQMDQCGKWVVLYSKTIGPFNANTSLPDVVVSQPGVPSVKITGKLVDCNQNPLTNGYLILRNDFNFDQISYADNGGDFQNTIFLCTNSPSVNLTAYDPDGLTTSGPLSFPVTGPSLALGNIIVCTQPGEYFEVTVDGKKYTFLSGFEGLTHGGETSIYGWEPDQNWVYTRFKNNGQTGTFPMEEFVLYPEFDTLSTTNLTTQLTQFGGVGQTFSGTFNGTVKTSKGQTRTVSGKYQILRDN